MVWRRAIGLFCCVSHCVGAPSPQNLIDTNRLVENLLNMTLYEHRGLVSNAMTIIFRLFGIRSEVHKMLQRVQILFDQRSQTTYQIVVSEAQVQRCVATGEVHRKSPAPPPHPPFCRHTRAQHPQRGPLPGFGHTASVLRRSTCVVGVGVANPRPTA